MPEFAEWGSFYAIVGPASGALIGPQFVVITLIAERTPVGAAEAGAAFASPTIVHFCAALFLALLLHAPWHTITVAATLWGVVGFSGAVYTAIAGRRMRRQAAYEAKFEDWLLHLVLPWVAYAILALTSFVSFSNTREALFGVGAAALLLLFTGIHNAWDNVAYCVLVQRTKP